MRLSEIYTSIQGEGPGVGWPTQFIRFAGCNLRCAGWPCDTQHAIDAAKYRQEWRNVTPDDILVALSPSVRRVTLTGGEPFIQKADQLANLVERLLHTDYSIEVFTNGTIPFPLWVLEPKVSIIMDWKLPDSGEDAYNQNRIANLTMLSSDDAIKFVCASGEDFGVACKLWATYLSVPDYSRDPQVFVGAAWGKIKEATVADWIREAYPPFKLNVQVHNYIFDKNARGI